SGSNDAEIKRCAVKPKPEPMRKMTRLGGKSALRPESIAAGSRLVGGGLEEFRQTQPDFMFAAGFDDRRVRAGEQVALDRRPPLFERRVRRLADDLRRLAADARDVLELQVVVFQIRLGHLQVKDQFRQQLAVLNSGR